MTTTSGSDRFCVAVYEPSADGLTLRSRTVDGDTFDRLREALDEVRRVDLNLHFKAAEHNKLALDGLVTALDQRRRVPVTERVHTPNAQQMQVRFLVLLANFLSSVRAYFDGTSDAISHQFGSNSEAYESFQRARNGAYDSSSEYRFFEQLRNVIQHSSDIPLQIDMAADEPGSARMRLRADRDALLASSVRWKAQVRTDIENGPQSRDIAVDLDLYWDKFFNIEQARVAFAARDAVPAMRVLHDELERLNLPAELPSALVHIVGDDIEAISWGFSRDQLARNIELSLAGTAHHPGVRAEVPAPGRSGVTQEAYDVMSAWVLSGPDGAFEVLNVVAQDEQGVENTVAGLVNMTAISLAQVQAVLGHDIHTFLSGMVDGPDEPGPDGADPSAVEK